MKFAEFFAGGGMAALGLRGWECVLANDIDPKKSRSYRRNHKHHERFVEGDISTISRHSFLDLPDLVWGSFPCQDLSLAGNGKGLKGSRSGTYFEFWRIIDDLHSNGWHPPIVAVENVVGSLSSNRGSDFEAICQAFVQRGYRFEAFVIDASHFVPQSRPRLFVIGVHSTAPIPDSMLESGNSGFGKTTASINALNSLPKEIAAERLSLRLMRPTAKVIPISQLIDEKPSGINWHTKEQTEALLQMMSAENRRKVSTARLSRKREIGFIYKRTRKDEFGRRVQRAEVRFDGLAGCLRTPGGGSSRQIVMEINGEQTSSRLLSIREGARLMGLPESYQLPANYNEGYHLVGDGVVVPVVEFLDHQVFRPLLQKRGFSIAAE